MRARVALASAVALVLLVWAFDWTWFRPLIQHHVHERSGRRVDFTKLEVGLNRSLQPTVRLRNLLVQNAPWAAEQPLVRAAELDFTVAWESLRGDQLIVTRLVLVDADLDLERQADGLRNWRLTRPDDRGPGRVRVLSVDAQRTRARVVDAGLDLELDLRTTPLDSPQRLAAHGDLPLTKSLNIRGTRNGTEFHAQAAVSDVLTFFDTGESFALRGQFETAQSQLSVEGTSRDVLALAGFDVDLHLSGKRLADLAAVLGAGVHPPPLPTDAQGHVRKDGKLWAVSRLKARLGGSDLSGTLSFDQHDAGAARSTLRANLSSERLNLGELRPRAAGNTSAPPGGRLDSRLQDLDAQIELTVRKLEGIALGPIGMLRTRASMRDGRLRVAPLEFAVAGGHAGGTLTLDTARSPAEAAVELQLRGLHLAQLLNGRPGVEQVEGELDVRVAMQARGDSLTSLRGSAAGSVKAELVHATLPTALDAKLGLDGGRWLRSLFSPRERVAITCSALELRFAAGKGQAHRLAIETDRVALSGTGWVDLARESFDVVLTPHRKQVALLALNKSVQVSGSFKEAKVSVVDIGDTPRRDACVPGTAQ